MLLSLLVSLAPLIGTVGLDLINFFYASSANKAVALATYQAALDKQKNAGSVSAGEKSSYGQQVTDLENQVAASDAAAAKPDDVKKS